MATEHSHGPHKRLAIRRTPLQKAVGNGLSGLVYLAAAALMGFMLMAYGPEFALSWEFGVATASMGLTALILFGEAAAILWARAAQSDGRHDLGPRRLASICLWSLVLLAAANGGYVIYLAALAHFFLIPLLSLMALMPGLAASALTRRTVRRMTHRGPGLLGPS